MTAAPQQQATGHGAEPDAAEQLEQLATTLDEAMARTRSLDPLPKQIVYDSLDALNALHKAAFTTIVRTLKADPRGKELLFELVDDPGVHMVLAMHGIIRADPATAARAVLDRVRPGLQSHGGDVAFDSVRDGVAFVRLQGACNGCSMAAVTLRETVEVALLQGVPGLRGVEVLPNEPAGVVIPVSSLGIGPPGVAASAPPSAADSLRAGGWQPSLTVAEVPVGELRPVELDSPVGTQRLILVNTAGQLAAYVNSCAHQGMPLDDAVIDPVAGTLTCSWHGFCYDATNGECLSLPGAQLEQLPVRIDDGRVWIRTSDLVDGAVR